ncbi:MAG: FAD-binding oxidoreductase [Acidimicrobiales bacterium]|nr:FAD-binding oxidoreductase [Acidimicrobiales bacterium]
MVGHFELVSGWGRTSPSYCDIHRPISDQEVAEIIESAKRTGKQIVPRGLGRSYGDAAQLGGNIVIDVRSLDHIYACDLDSGLISVGAGISLDALMRIFIPMGWFVPVTPGTRFVTVGGAIAADVHGKNHHVDGSFGNHVASLTLISSKGVMELDPSNEEFWATVGGMGLTGTIVRATIRMSKIETSLIKVDTERASNIDELINIMETTDDNYKYSVAWIDLISSGKNLGRSVLTRGDHALLEDLPAAKRKKARYFDPKVGLKAPLSPPFSPLTPLTVRTFNTLWYHKSPTRKLGEIQEITKFFHPLDGVGDWNKLYGPKGFCQYQFVVPFGQEDALKQIIDATSRSKMTSFLAVLKRFGEGNASHLSFPSPGWTLALDVALGALGPAKYFDYLDNIVLKAGGKIYLAKDSRVRPDLFSAMYPNLPKWQVIRDRLDPDNLFSSDLAKRLSILETK